MTDFAVAVRFGGQILADAIEVFWMLQAGTTAGGHETQLTSIRAIAIRRPASRRHIGRHHT